MYNIASSSETDFENITTDIVTKYDKKSVYEITSGTTGVQSVVNSPTLTTSKNIVSYFAVGYTPIDNEYLTEYKFYADSGSITGLTLEVRETNTIGTLIYTASSITIDDLGTSNYIGTFDCPMVNTLSYVIMLTGLTADKIIGSSTVSPNHTQIDGIYFDSGTIDTTATVKCSFTFERSSFKSGIIEEVKYKDNGLLGKRSYVQSYGGTVGLNAYAYAISNLIVRNLNPNNPVNITSQTRSEDTESGFWLSNNFDATTWSGFTGRGWLSKANPTASNILSTREAYRVGESNFYDIAYEQFNTSTNDLDKYNRHSNSFIFTDDDSDITANTNSYNALFELQNKTSLSTANSLAFVLNNRSDNAGHDGDFIFKGRYNDMKISLDNSSGERSLLFKGETTQASGLFQPAVLGIKTFDTYSPLSQRVLVNGEFTNVDLHYSYNNDGNFFINLAGTAIGRYQTAINIDKPPSNIQTIYPMAVCAKLNGTSLVSNQNRTAFGMSVDDDASFNLEFYNGSTSNTALSKEFEFKSTGRLYANNLAGSSTSTTTMQYNTGTKEIYYLTSALKYKTVINNDMNTEMTNTSDSLFDNLTFKEYTQKPPEPIYKDLHETIYIEKLDENGDVMLGKDGEIIWLETLSDYAIGQKVVNQDRIDEINATPSIVGLIADEMPEYATVYNADGSVEAIDHTNLLYLALIQIEKLRTENQTLNNNYIALQQDYQTMDENLKIRIDNLVSQNNLTEI